MIKVIIIDAEEGKLEIKKINPSLNEYYKIIKCNTIDIVSRKIGKKTYDVIVDDEGLLKEDAVPSMIDRRARIDLVGTIIICNSKETEEGTYEWSLDEKDIDNILKHVYVFNNGERDLHLVECDVL